MTHRRGCSCSTCVWLRVHVRGIAAFFMSAGIKDADRLNIACTCGAARRSVAFGVLRQARWEVTREDPVDVRFGDVGGPCRAGGAVSVGGQDAALVASSEAEAGQGYGGC